MKQTNLPKICFVVASYTTAECFLKDHIKEISRIADVYLVANLEGNNYNPIKGVKCVKDISIQRGISIFNDVNSVIRLWLYFKKEQFDIVHSVTPKAGLVTALAAKLVDIKHRIHIFTGQVWATRTGVMRSLLKSLDKMIATLDNHILVDGESQRQFLISEGVISDSKSMVLGAGSICGANLNLFTPKQGERERQRDIMKIPENKTVFCFMGRLNKEKGVYELFEAFNNIVVDKEDAFLLLFGNDEEGCINYISNYPNIKPGENFLYYGPTKTPNISLQAADVFCLPSYREGFGMSVVEASALEIPVICSDTYGLADTIADGETGLRCKVADVPTLEKAMIELYNDKNLRLQLGKNGRNRVLKLFRGETIVAEWVKYYQNLLK